MRGLFRFLIAACLFLPGLACQSQEQSAETADSSMSEAASTANPDWTKFMDDFVEWYLKANPTEAVYAGRHEFDGMLPNLSAGAIQDHILELKDRLAAARAFDPATLDHDQRFEREYFMAEMDKELFNYERRQRFRKDPMFYNWPVDPGVYATREYAPLETRLAGLTKHLQGIPRVMDQMKANLEAPLPRPYLELGVQVFGGMVSYFQDDLPGIFASVEDPEAQESFATANRSAVAAIQDAVDWMKTQLPEATEDFALGPDLYLEMLRRTEGLDVTLPELKAAGERDMERNLAALAEACNEYAPGSSIPECMEKANADKPEGGAVEGARAQLAELKEFLLEKDLITVPSDEVALVAEAPPYARWNFAYIDTPGPYEKDLPAIYYIAPPDPTWPQEKQDAYTPGRTNVLFVSVHEVWPGHFTHFLHAERAGSKFARMFTGYAFSEGWAHYTEEMMWDAGLGDGDPEVHIGQLAQALWRNARYLSSIGLHTEGMTVEESEALFRNKAFLDEGNAHQQAVRGTFDPGYLNYTLGKLMIMKLRDDWTATRGGRAAWKEFHDTFLSYGGPPIPMVRRDMMGEDSGAVLPTE